MFRVLILKRPCGNCEACSLINSTTEDTEKNASHKCHVRSHFLNCFFCVLCGYETHRQRTQPQNRSHCRHHDLLYDGLHRDRQSANPFGRREDGDGVQRRADGDGPGLLYDDALDGRLREAPVRGRAGHGHQCVLHLHDHSGQRRAVADGAGNYFLGGHYLPADLSYSHSRIDCQSNSHRNQNRRRRGHRHFFSPSSV